jgi:hypothetical protein
VVSHIKSRNAHTLFSLTEFYINECLQPRLLPFINKHHSDFSFQFVHDLAKAHFSIETFTLMKETLPSLKIGHACFYMHVLHACKHACYMHVKHACKNMHIYMHVNMHVYMHVKTCTFTCM